MPNYRRYYVPGGTYFFTCVTHQRFPLLADETARACLKAALQKVQADHPFEIVAIVLLPDHWHTVWTLPAGDDRYPLRWMRIKEEFSRVGCRPAESNSLKHNHGNVSVTAASGRSDIGNTLSKTKSISTDVSTISTGIRVSTGWSVACAIGLGHHSIGSSSQVTTTSIGAASIPCPIGTPQSGAAIYEP